MNLDSELVSVLGKFKLIQKKQQKNHLFLNKLK